MPDSITSANTPIHSWMRFASKIQMPEMLLIESGKYGIPQKLGIKENWWYSLYQVGVKNYGFIVYIITKNMKKPYYEKPRFKLHNSDCLEILKELPENLVDMIFADYPFFYLAEALPAKIGK